MIRVCSDSNQIEESRILVKSLLYIKTAFPNGLHVPMVRNQRARLAAIGFLDPALGCGDPHDGAPCVAVMRRGDSEADSMSANIVKYEFAFNPSYLMDAV